MVVELDLQNAELMLDKILRQFRGSGEALSSLEETSALWFCSNTLWDDTSEGSLELSSSRLKTQFDAYSQVQI